MRIRNETTFTGNTIITIEIADTEMVRSISTHMQRELKKLYDKTGKISDGLMYLSEVAKNIEDYYE